MYLIDSMVDMGLENGQEWSTDAHRIVAQIVLIGNPFVKGLGDLRDAVAAINSVPDDQIKLVTPEGLRDDYGLCGSL